MYLVIGLARPPAKKRKARFAVQQNGLEIHLSRPRFSCFGDVPPRPQAEIKSTCKAV
ncbi:hypothetical protein PBR20603_01863 [Pandoraea bronchicola]|uniref:Uncharacterized protein n=1 Tax=Pandoraea bronchicola TaxID=2508287 RepID=A0A5E5BS13_9BURK|nr:hypothetical protein PBR20603_01863 [Pandoraea bronchicola]